ncbi:hypothetical protein dqs_2864 [Azoarcus olearius]|uniref:hypothetical protein n=1 Tax=Azoarcus sp. (strain BH72) TaxID=418699 RepID=UPI0008063EF7|nr:hypothetical protein [Azoarcus olearius]ANQ85892.1 hypothetical protein dqs_2864 [Azoarcus olearius]
MRTLLIALPAALLLGAGCSTLDEYRPMAVAHGGTAAGLGGGALLTMKTMKEIGISNPVFLSGALVAYGIYDPLAPTWELDASLAGEETWRLEMRMKRLATGGEGEARQVFMRNARRMAEEGGYAGFDVLRYEEGISNERPFARRTASGEIRLVKSRQFPSL